MEPALTVALVASLAGLAYALHLLAMVKRQCETVKQQSDEQAQRFVERAASRDRFEATLGTLMRNCGCGVVVVGADQTIQAINSDARTLLDVAIANPVGRHINDAMIATTLPALLRQTQTSGAPLVTELARVGPSNGSVSVSVAPVNTHEGLCGWVVVAHDLSALRRLEAIRRDFVANVSHELRTPMASIRAMAETLRDGALNDAEVANRFLSTIVAESERLTRISEDLLTLSDAESRPPEKSVFSLTQLVEQTVKRFDAQATRAGLKMHLECFDDVIVCGSKDQLEQVTLNLIDNAIKYTPRDGSVTVTVRRSGESAVLTVADTGIGILAEHLPRIFERFYRVDKARSRQSGGTGLGLSIVKNIVEAHGGAVTAASEFNRGSAFTVTLPCHSVAL